MGRNKRKKGTTQPTKQRGVCKYPPINPNKLDLYYDKYYKNEDPLWAKQFPSQDELNFCCYRFINDDGEIIYVGRAKNLVTRLDSHEHLPKECYKQIEKIEYCKFDSNDDLDLAEPYFIAKWKPKFNQDFVNKKYSFTLREFEEKEWKILKNKSIKGKK